MFFYALPNLIMFMFRLFRASPASRKPVSRRKQAPGYHKARIEALARNIKSYGVQTCELCYRTQREGVHSFEVHHVKSWKRWPEKRVDPNNLAVTCRSCNRGMSDDRMDLSLNKCERKHAS
jgi:hypothetical protein